MLSDATQIGLEVDADPINLETVTVDLSGDKPDNLNQPVLM